MISLQYSPSLALFLDIYSKNEARAKGKEKKEIHRAKTRTDHAAGRCNASFSSVEARAVSVICFSRLDSKTKNEQAHDYIYI